MKKEKIAVTSLMIISLFLAIVLNAAEIHETVKNGDLEKVKSLIQNDKQLVNLKDDAGRTPLHWASRGVYPEIMQFLIQNGADVNALDNNMVTPLISIASRGHLEAAKLLLKNGSNVHAESNEYNRTALFYSVLGGHKEVTELLLKNGAKVDINVGFGRTPLYYAVIKGHAEIAKSLIAGGADKNFMMNDGLSLLHLAVISNDIEIVKTLVSMKCDVNSNQKSGLTPLHLAANYGTSEIANLLIKSGANLNFKTKEGASPYNYAIASNHGEITNLLLKNNASKEEWNFPKNVDPYLNIKEPELEPIVFNPSNVILNLYMPHGGLTFSANNEDIFWTRNSASMGSKIWYMRKKNDTWLPPKIFTSNDKYSEEDPFFSPDGQKLFFSSDRPYVNDTVTKRHDIWFIEKVKGNWSEPQPTGIQKYFEYAEVSRASVSKQGTLFFTLIKSENNMIVDIYSSKFINGVYTNPEKLGESINTKYMELGPFIAPDESYIIFNSHRPNGGWLISFKNQKKNWSEPQNLDKVLPDFLTSCQGISSDGKFLFFNGQEDNIVNHYWISSDIIEDLK